MAITSVDMFYLINGDIFSGSRPLSVKITPILGEEYTRQVEFGKFCQSNRFGHGN